jgi:hypothetical protein
MRDRGWTLAVIVSNSSVGRLCSDCGEVILLLAWKSLNRGQWAIIAMIARSPKNKLYIV